MNLKESVRKTIISHNLIERDDILVLGLSGGPDSLSLLHILKILEDEFGFTLYALHLNHKMRVDADDDMNWLIAHCKELGVELKCVCCNVEELAKERGESSEECGRKLRHEELSKYANELSSKYHRPAKVVLAHNEDDQAETVLLRILRGTGIHGLVAMEYKREDGLIRPLLDTKRSDIEEYCKNRNLEPRMDSTNQETNFLRNKVRLQLLPELEKLNPSIKKSLQRLAANASATDDYISKNAKFWLAANASQRDGKVIICVRDLQTAHPAIFARALQLAFAKLGLEEDISAVHINALSDAVARNVGNKKIEFPHSYYAYINHGEVELGKKQ